MADTLADKPSTAATYQQSISGVQINLTIDGGSGTSASESPQIFSNTGDKDQIAYWNNTNSTWTSSGLVDVIDGIPVDQWLNENSRQLTSSVNYNGEDLTKEEKERLMDSFSAFKIREDTKAEVPEGEKKNTTNFDRVIGGSIPRQGTESSETAFAIEPILKYPLDHAGQEYDFIKIIPIEYVPALGTSTFSRTGPKSGNIDLNSDTWFGFKDVKQRYMRIKKVGSTVFLPMTPDIQESNAVDWGSDTLNPMQAAGARIGIDAIGNFGNSNSLGDVGNAMSNLIGQGSQAAQAFMNTPGMGSFIKAYFAGQAVNANILGRAGIAINPNLEVLFNGPALRTFTYNFRFTPRERQEARTVRKIIKLFKKTMAVKRRDKVFLSVPAVYKIQYIFNTGFRDHPFLNKIKPCALTSFNVQYAPDGSYMTYQDGSMTAYNVQMKFDELEPIYNDDINDVDDPTTGF